MTTAFTGELTTDQTFVRPRASPLTHGTFTGVVAGFSSYNYFNETFRPSVDGSYSIEVTAAAPVNRSFLLLYADSFDPANPLSNFLIGDEISGVGLLSRIGSVALTSGHTYITVMTNFLSGLTGAVTFEIVGPGSVAVGAPTVIDDSQPVFDETSGALQTDPVTFDGGTFQPGTTTTLGQAIVVEVTGGTVDANGSVVSLTGSIAGAGTLAVTGAGQVVLTGPASNDGGFTIGAGGTLIVNGTVLGPVVVGATGTLGGTGTLSGPLTFAGGSFQPGAATSLEQATVVQGSGGTVDTGGSVVSFSTITGAGTLAVAGAGQLVVTGSASNAGGFTVDAGASLLVGGAVSGPVVVGAGGTLGGTGTLSGPVAAAGTIAPGGSPGTLTVAADVVLASGGALEIEIDGPGTGTGAGNYDRLVITGAGNSFTADGTLRIALRGIGAPADNDFTPSVGQGFAIVSAAGGVAGSFATVAQPAAGLPAGTRFDTVYAANDLTVYLTPASYADLAAAGLRESANERAVGAVLEAFREPAGTAPAGNLGPVLDALAPLGDGQIQAALDSLGPELHADMMLAAVATRRLFGQLLFDHLAALRRDPDLSAGLGPLTRMHLAFGTPLASAAEIAPAAGPEPAGSGRTILWGQAAGGFGSTGGDGNGAGFDRQTGAMMVGAEAALADRLIGGVGLGFGRSWVDADADLGDGTVDSYQAVLYGGAAFGASYAQASVGYGFAQYDTKRDVALGALSQQAKGDAHGHDLAIDTEAGHGFTFDPVTLELHGGLRWDRLHRDDFTEHDAGGLGLDVDSETLNSVRSTLGARISLPLELSDGGLRPELRFGWRHEWADQTAKASAALGGAEVQVEATEVGHDAGYVGLGVAARLADRVRLFADAEAEVRKEDRQGQIVLGIAFAW